MAMYVYHGGGDGLPTPASHGQPQPARRLKGDKSPRGDGGDMGQMGVDDVAQTWEIRQVYFHGHKGMEMGGCVVF